MSSKSTTQPALTPKLITDEKEILVRAAEKWLKFNQAVWDHINLKLQVNIERSGKASLGLRLVIIVLAAAITTLSDIEAVSRTFVTIIAGVLTALTGIEAYLKLGERHLETKRQQREIEALRDRYRFRWFVEVETEPDMEKRIHAAKKLLEEAPEAYNDVLNKYALKAEKGEAPQANT